MKLPCWAGYPRSADQAIPQVDPHTYRSSHRVRCGEWPVPVGQDPRPIDLRHGFATRALEAGVPAKVVQEVLGHANVAITLDLYSHVVRPCSGTPPPWWPA
jgi:integrase